MLDLIEAALNAQDFGLQLETVTPEKDTHEN